MSWNKLPPQSKQELFKLYLKHGYSNYSDITNHYNQFKEGGDLNTQVTPDYTFKPVEKQQFNSIQDWTSLAPPPVQPKAPILTPITPKDANPLFKKYPIDSGVIPLVNESTVTNPRLSDAQIINKESLKVHRDYEEDDYVYTPTQVNKTTDLKGKSKEEVKKIQADLLQKGLYQSKLLDSSTLDTKEKVSQLQKQLAQEGYTMDRSRTKFGGFDGILGSETAAAIKAYNAKVYNKEVDGVVGKRTQEAYTNLTKDRVNIKNFNVISEREAIVNTVPYNLELDKKIGKSVDFKFSKFKTCEGNTTDVKECTRYINNKLSEVGINRDKIGAVGDAWTIGRNLVAKGGEVVYDVGYKKPKEYSRNLVESSIESAIKESGVPDKSMFAPGQYVELYYKGSNSLQKAFEQGGKTATTHTGLVTEDNNGNLFIEHNVNGTIHKDPLDQMINGKKHSKITRVIQPKYQSTTSEESRYVDMTNLGIEFNKKSRGQNIADENAYLFQKAIVVNKDNIQQNYGLDDEDFKIVNKIAYGVGANESYFGKAQGYQDKQNPRKLIADFSKTNIKDGIVPTIRTALTYSKLGRLGAEVMDKHDVADASRGWGQVKEEELFTPEYLESTGLQNKMDTQGTDNPEYSALSTVSSIAAKYKVLSSLIAELDVNINRKEFEALLATSHNQGFNNIKKDLEEYKKTGDYKKITQYNDFRYPSNVRAFSDEYVTFK